MKCLITGGAGFIGLHLAARLLHEGHSVAVVDNFSRGKDDADLQALIAEGLDVRSADLTDESAWPELGTDWDEVYHLVAVVGVRNVEQDPLRCVRVNTLPLMHLIEWARPSMRVFYSSTSEVYAGGVDLGLVPIPTPESAPVVIEDVSSPRFAYATSKLLGEAAIIHAIAAGRFGGVVGRFHNVYGPRMGHDHVVPEMLARAAAGQNPFIVWGADQTRAFCYVDDAIDGILAATRSDALAGRIVHIGNGTEETRIADLAELVVEVVGSGGKREPRPAPVGSVVRRCPDVSLLEGATGFTPKVDLAEGVRRTWEWYRTA